MIDAVHHEMEGMVAMIDAVHHVMEGMHLMEEHVMAEWEEEEEADPVIHHTHDLHRGIVVDQLDEEADAVDRFQVLHIRAVIQMIKKCRK